MTQDRRKHPLPPPTTASFRDFARSTLESAVGDDDARVQTASYRFTDWAAI